MSTVLTTIRYRVPGDHRDVERVMTIDHGGDVPVERAVTEAMAAFDAQARDSVLRVEVVRRG